MYSTTISPRGIRSDGQLHRHSAVPPAPPRTAAPPPATMPPASKPPARGLSLGSISAEQVLIMVIAYLLLQNDKPDWLLIIALVYVLF